MLGYRHPPQQSLPEQTHTPKTRHSPRSRHPPGADTPPGADIPRSRHPPRYRHPPPADTPLQQTATAADSSHPTGMHSCISWSHAVRRRHDKSQSQVLLMLVHKYMDENGSAANRSAGVAPEVNLRIPLCTGDKAFKWGIHSGFETSVSHPKKGFF